MMKTWGLVAALCVGTAQAQDVLPSDARRGFDQMDQEQLRAVLIENGLNLRPHERHAVTVEGCQMTTEWWRLREADRWVMWSSFQFQMAAAQLGDGSAVPAEIAMEGHTDLEDMALFVFKMVSGSAARHEVPFERRDPKEAPRASPRGDGSTHHFLDATRFFVRHENHGIADRARRFSAAYVEYVRRYCNLTG